MTESKYTRAVQPDNCTHSSEDHVVHGGDGYRGQLRCRCGVIEVTHPKPRASHVEAQQDGRDMLRRVLQPPDECLSARTQ